MVAALIQEHYSPLPQIVEGPSLLRLLRKK